MGFHDDDLADEAERIERRTDLAPWHTRQMIRELVLVRYTLPEERKGKGGFDDESSRSWTAESGSGIVRPIDKNVTSSLPADLDDRQTVHRARIAKTRRPCTIA